MQEYKKIVITKDQIVPIAEKMRKEGRLLVIKDLLLYTYEG